MLKNRAARIVFTLLILALLCTIGRNLYRRYLIHRLIAAVESKNVAAARSLLEWGADPSGRETDERGREVGLPVLMLALNKFEVTPEKYGNFPPEAETIACLLIQHGADISTRTGSYYLKKACERGSVAVTRCLLEHGADPNADNSVYDTPLYTAIQYQSNLNWMFSKEQKKQEAQRKQSRRVSRELIELLRAHGAKVTPGQAAELDDVDALRRLLDTETSVDQRQTVNSRQINLLTLASLSGSLKCVRLLIERGANINSVPANYPSTPLLAAIQGKHLEIARLLVQRGASVNAHALREDAPLVVACRNLPQLVPDLLQRGADLRTQGNQALAAAIHSQNRDVVALLMQQMQQRPKPDTKTLEEAIEYRPDLVPILLTRGASAHETSPQQGNLIWHAVHSGHKELIVPLLRAGANVNGHNGNTALIEAAGQDVETVKILLDHGADPNVVVADITTPLVVAAQTGKAEVARLLLRQGAQVNGKGRLGNTPLYYARRHKHPEVAALLEQAGGKEK